VAFITGCTVGLACLSTTHRLISRKNDVGTKIGVNVPQQLVHQFTLLQVNGQAQKPSEDNAYLM